MNEEQARTEIARHNTDNAAIICAPFYVLMVDGLFSVRNNVYGSTGYGHSLDEAIRECAVGILMNDPRRLIV